MTYIRKYSWTTVIQMSQTATVINQSNTCKRRANLKTLPKWIINKAFFAEAMYSSLLKEWLHDHLDKSIYGKLKNHQKANKAKHTFILGAMQSKGHNGVNPAKMSKDEAEMCKTCSSTVWLRTMSVSDFKNIVLFQL